VIGIVPMETSVVVKGTLWIFVVLEKMGGGTTGGLEDGGGTTVSVWLCGGGGGAVPVDWGEGGGIVFCVVGHPYLHEVIMMVLMVDVVLMEVTEPDVYVDVTGW